MIHFDDDCSDAVWCYSSVELIKLNNSGCPKRNVQNSINETFLKRCFTIVIDLIVFTRNRFFSSDHKTFVIENTLCREIHSLIRFNNVVVKTIITIFLENKVHKLKVDKTKNGYNIHGTDLKTRDKKRPERSSSRQQ